MHDVCSAYLNIVLGKNLFSIQCNSINLLHFAQFITNVIIFMLIQLFMWNNICTILTLRVKCKKLEIFITICMFDILLAQTPPLLYWCQLWTVKLSTFVIACHVSMCKKNF